MKPILPIDKARWLMYIIHMKKTIELDRKLDRRIVNIRLSWAETDFCIADAKKIGLVQVSVAGYIKHLIHLFAAAQRIDIGPDRTKRRR